MTARYAFWSQQYVDRGHRTQVWLTPDGRELEACFVLTSQTAPNSWSDIQLLGEVVQFLRYGQRSIQPPDN